MRILHFIPDIGISNGVMSVILNYAAAMPENITFDVVYFQHTEKTKQAQIEALGGEVFRVNSPLSAKSFVLSFDKLLKRNKGRWEAVHIHVPYYSCLIAPIAKRHGIKKVCCHCHSTEFSMLGKLTPLFKVMNWPTKLAVKKRFACSRDAGMVWYKKENAFEVLNNAIDCAHYRFNPSVRTEVRRRMSLDDRYIVGHVGTGLLEQKNHRFLFKIFAEIAKTRSNAMLLLIGAEKDDRLSGLCRQNGIEDKVMFLGLRNDVPDLLQAMDMFIFPSVKEGLPVAVIEAQAAGLPVLLSDSVTDECVVTDLVKRLSLRQSPAEWAAMCEAHSAQKRRDTFEAMKAAGWDIHSAAEKLVNYYLN